MKFHDMTQAESLRDNVLYYMMLKLIDHKENQAIVNSISFQKQAGVTLAWMSTLCSKDNVTNSERLIRQRNTVNGVITGTTSLSPGRCFRRKCSEWVLFHCSTSVSCKATIKDRNGQAQEKETFYENCGNWSDTQFTKWLFSTNLPNCTFIAAILSRLDSLSLWLYFAR